MATLRHALFLVMVALTAHAADPAGPRLPQPLAVLQSELAKFPYCPDEACSEGADWWGFWWSLPEQGCGDCEDFAAYSYARLEQLGIPRDDVRLMAAEVGEQPLPDGGLAKLLHVWLEVSLDGSIWTVWNRQIRHGSERRGRMLTDQEVQALVDERFGPNWPYGIDMP